MPGGRARCLTTSYNIHDAARIRRCRAYSSVVLKGEQLGPIHRDEHQSFRVRKKGKPLPLPPVLDPVVLEKRSKWEKTKSRPIVENFTPFQKKLWENPYAHALASPVRQCKITTMLYPSHLMVALHPRPHPETGDPWLVPVSLTTSTKHLGLPYHFLGRYTIAKGLADKDAWRRGMYHRLAAALGRKVGKVVWREDLADLVLSLLRKKLFNSLKWHFKRNGRLVTCPSPRSTDIDGVDDVSCVICFGSLKTQADEIQMRAEELEQRTDQLAKHFAKRHRDRLDPHDSKEVTHHPPSWWRGPVVPLLQLRTRFPELEFKTSGWRNSRVAVYSLTDLLGEESVKDLALGSKFDGERCLVVKRGRHNVPVELLLMQLQSYLAKPGP